MIISEHSKEQSEVVVHENSIQQAKSSTPSAHLQTMRVSKKLEHAEHNIISIE